MISVIIPVYNDYDRLTLCLDALINQRIPTTNFEVIVVNNGLFAPSAIDVKYFDALNLRLVDEPVLGSYAARNRGISIAKHSILAFTDSDCIPDENWLCNSLKFFKEDVNFELGILTGPVPLFYRDANKLSLAEIYEKHTGFDFSAYVKEGSCGAGNWFSHKYIIEEYGGFNPSLKSNGDTDLSKRISRKYDIVFSPDVIVRHPARYYVKDIVYKYRRLLGGTYQRRFNGKEIEFWFHVFNFSWRRVRFSAKKFFTVPIYESKAIFLVCIAIIIGAWKEYLHLISGGETKR